MIKILVVEPNKQSCKTILNLLSFMGYAEESASNCNEALARAVEHNVDLIFISRDLSTQDRETLSRHLLNAGIEIPTVVYAGSGESTDLMHQAGEYLTSPFVASALNQTIRRLLPDPRNILRIAS